MVIKCRYHISLSVGQTLPIKGQHSVRCIIAFVSINLHYRLPIICAFKYDKRHLRKTELRRRVSSLGNAIRGWMSDTKLITIKVIFSVLKRLYYPCVSALKARQF